MARMMTKENRQQVDSSKPVQVINLTKRFSSHSKTLQSSRRIQGIGDLVRFFKVLFGPKEKNLVALDNVSFEVNKGEIFGLLGPNGAGKTTLIKILSTLILQDSGKAYTFGIDIAKYPRRALKIIQTALAEVTGFERRLTGRQNLELFAELYGIPREVARRRIEELLALTGIQKYADVSNTRYSPVQQKDLSSVGFYSAMLPFLSLMNRQQAWMHLPLWNSEGCSKTFSSSRNRRR